MSIRNVWAIALIGLTVLSGCATTSTKLTQVWNNPGYGGDSIDKVLVIGISERAATKRLFENRMVALFRAKGVEAEPSFERIPVTRELDKAAVRAAIEGRGYDAVLVTRLIAVDTDTEFVPGSTYVVRHWGGSHYDSFYPYYTQSYEVVHTPGYLIENKVVRLETNVYDVSTESLTWASVSETFNPESAIDAIDNFGAAVLDDLERQGLILTQ